jgi:hypothetical protein
MASVRKFSSWPLYFDKESKEEWKGRGLKKLKALTTSAHDVRGVKLVSSYFGLRN